jgi:class 3 adenylate cyclase/tetratricopeptide (TPR) repeat protein
MEAGRVMEPQEVVALLFTDRAGSADAVTTLGDDAADELRAVYLSLVRTGIAAAGGEEVSSLGDGVLAVFASPIQSLSCAIAMQRAIAEHNRVNPGRELQPRMGLHVGVPAEDAGGVDGTPAAMAKRLCDQAQGGEILASELVAGLVGSRGGFRFRPAGSLRLENAAPFSTVAVDWHRTGVGAAVAAPRPARSRARPAIRRGPALVGRDRELGLLEAELEAAAGGGLRTVLILGEPGVGKTRLGRELLTRHADRTVVLSARAYPFGETSAFGLWAEAFDGCLRRLPRHEVAHLCRDCVNDLAGLLRSVAAVNGTRPGREATRSRLLEGLAVLLSNLADRDPVLVVLDDVHLADASSWEALHYLAHNLSGARVLVVATARPAELAEQGVASQVVLGLEQEGLLSRLSLHALDARGLAQLAGGELEEEPSAALVDWLVHRSQGNPLFALGLLRALVEEGADLSAPQLRRLPEGLVERVGGRLKLLDDGARGVLELLAVLGHRVELDDLANLSDRTMDQLAASLDRLVQVRLVDEVEHGRELTYEVVHPLVQEGIYQSMGVVRRRTVHRQVARVLFAAGRHDAAAPHYARSADVGDAEAVDALSDALRGAEERQAHRESLRILASLVEILPSGDGRWLQVADAMSEKAEWVYRGRTHAAMGIKAMREIDLVLQRSHEPGRRAMAKFRMANFLTYGTGELAEAERACGQALELFQQAGDSRMRLLAALELATLRGFRGNLAWWEEGARHVAGAADERFVAIQALGGIGHVAAHRGRFREAEAAYRENLAIARGHGRPELLSMSLIALATCLSWEGRVPEALHLLAEARSVDPAWRETLFLEWGAMVHWLAGDVPAVLANAEESMTRNLGAMSKRRGHAMHFGALAALEAGEIGLAEKYARRAREAYGETDWFFYTHYCTYVEAMLAGQRGGGQAATVSILRDVAEKLLAMEVLPQTAWVLASLVDIAARSGRNAVAAEATTLLDEVAQRIDRDLYRGLASLAIASTDQACGAMERAAESAREALRLLGPTGCRAFVGRAQDVLGRSLATIDPVGAREALEGAVSTFDACGAVWRRDRAREALQEISAELRIELAGRRVDRPNAGGEATDLRLGIEVGQM